MKNKTYFACFYLKKKSTTTKSFCLLFTDCEIKWSDLILSIGTEFSLANVNSNVYISSLRNLCECMYNVY